MLKSQHEFVENSPSFVNRLITVAIQKEFTDNLNKQLKDIKQFGQDLKVEINEEKEMAQEGMKKLRKFIEDVEEDLDNYKQKQKELAEEDSDDDSDDDYNSSDPSKIVKSSVIESVSKEESESISRN